MFMDEHCADIKPALYLMVTHRIRRQPRNRGNIPIEGLHWHTSSCLHAYVGCGNGIVCNSYLTKVIANTNWRCIYQVKYVELLWSELGKYMWSEVLFDLLIRQTNWKWNLHQRQFIPAIHFLSTITVDVIFSLILQQFTSFAGIYQSPGVIFK